MRVYLLDSGPVAAFLLGRKAAVDLITPWIMNSEAATSILVCTEVVEYIKGRPFFFHHHEALRDLFSEVYPYFLTFSILDRYADIRRMLRLPYGTGLIGDIDTLIAATALELDLTVVTVDGDFERVPGLKVMKVVLKS